MQPWSQPLLWKGAAAVSGVTWDPTTVSNATLSNGNLTLTGISAGGGKIPNACAQTSGKYYFEITWAVMGGFINGGAIGIATTTATYADVAAAHANTTVLNQGDFSNTGKIWSGGVFSGYFLGDAGSHFLAAGMVFGFAVDLNNGKMWVKVVTPSFLGNLWNGNASADPATNVNGVAVPAGAVLPIGGFNTNADVYTANFGGSSFVGAVPSGFYAGWLCGAGFWDTFFKAPTITLSNGNATASSTNNSFQTFLASQPLVQKTYWEVNVDSKGTGNVLIGVAFQSAVLATVVPSAIAGLLYNSNGLMAAPLNVSYTTGDRIGVAFDPATGKLWFSKNGTWLGSDPSGAAAATIAKAAGRTYYPCGAYTGTAGGSQTFTLVTSVGSFTGTLPAGYSPIVTAVKPKFAFNPVDIGSNLALSSNNTMITKSSTANSNGRMSVESFSGKQVWAVKVTADGVGTTVKAVGFGQDGDSLVNLLGNIGSLTAPGYRSDGTVSVHAVTIQTYAAYGLNDIVMLAYDTASRNYWFGLNGTWNGDPGAGTGSAATANADGSTENYRFLMAGMTDAGDALQMINWPYAVPVGFTAPPIALGNWNPADKASAMALSNSNLTGTAGQGGDWVRGTGSHSIGKYYFEGTANVISNNNDGIIGLAPSTTTPTIGAVSSGLTALSGLGGGYVNGTSFANLGARSNGDIIGVAVDLGAQLIWYRVAPSGNWNASGTANPATGVGGISISALTGPLFPIFASFNIGESTTANFGGSAFSSAVPSGFSAWG